MTSTQLQVGAEGITKVSGALTFATVNQLWQQSQSVFTRNSAQKISFDLEAVTQSDSAGVALLLAWIRAAHTKQKQIIFLSLPIQMQAIIKVSGLEGILEVK